MSDPAGKDVDVWERERLAHNAIARDLDPATFGDLPLAGEEILRRAGNVRDRRVLDAGCGQGDLTLALLAAGASVTALDVSDGMVDLTRRRVLDRFGHAQRFTGLAAPFEQSGLPDADFDVILGAYFLHHLQPAPALAEVERLLKVGGRAWFYENSSANPLLALARAHVVGRAGVIRLGTTDEQPLDPRAIERLGGGDLAIRSHYPHFDFFKLLDRQILRYRRARASRLLGGMDDLIERSGGPLRRYSYRFVIEVERRH